jgi:hypothetical protein
MVGGGGVAAGDPFAAGVTKGALPLEVRWRILGVSATGGGGGVGAGAGAGAGVGALLMLLSLVL